MKGLVKLGLSESDGKQVAIKIVQKAQLAEEERECIKTEVEVMSYIKHINVIRLHKVIENRISICMFLEFAAGGELFEHIIRQTKLSEAEARKFFVQLIDGLGYCHERMIVHRDIKAENGMLKEKLAQFEVLLDEDLSTIKLGDWGFATVYEPGKMLDTSCGSLDYSAPEILSGKSFGPEVDVWSLGMPSVFLSDLIGQECYCTLWSVVGCHSEPRTILRSFSE